MLWDVVSDEEIFLFLTPDIQSKISQLFINNIPGFFEIERTKTKSLVDLNKKYILLILNHIKKTYSYEPNKIKIYNEKPVKELITYEEIQNDRKTQFEKDLTRRQEEFEDSISIKAPAVPDFSDKKTDEPIKEMEKILKEMQAQRNYEVEQINRTYNNSNQIDNWLKPQDTSVKSDKFQDSEKHEENQSYSRFKFLNEFEQESSPTNVKKNVSWKKNNEVNIFNNSEEINEKEEDDNIFSKLKKVKKENIQLEIFEQPEVKQNFQIEDRILKLENEIKNIDKKMNKIIELLLNKNN